jgi:hypothetical protein
MISERVPWRRYGSGATGGAAVVVDAGATCGTGGVEGAAWGAAEVMGAARGHHLPLFRGWSDRLGSRSDRQPLFEARSDCPNARSD